MATGKEIFKLVRTGRISFIKLWFVDILGQLKSFSISPRELDIYLPVL